MSQLKPPIVVLTERVDRIDGEKVTYRNATVAATNPGLRLVDVDVENAGKLEGLRIPEGSFFPRVGDEGELRLQGSRVSWVANRLGEGTVGEDELAEPVVEKINVTLATANGKNAVTYSEDPPDDVATPGTAVGDIYWQLRPPVPPGDPDFPANPNFTLIGQWLWSGTTWAPATLGDEIFAYLTAAKIITGVLGVGVQITVGDPGGPHTVIDGTRGLVAQIPGTADEPAEVARFGATSGGRDPVTGRVTWSIDEKGHGSFTSASVGGDFRVGGTLVTDLLADSAGNVLDRYSGTLGSNLSPIGEGEVGIVEINGYLTAGRIYELSHRVPWGANDAADVQATIRPIWTGPASAGSQTAPAPLVTGSPQVVTAYYPIAPIAFVRNTHTASTLFEPSVTGRHRFLLAIRKSFGTGTIAVFGDRDVEFWLTDKGPKPAGAGGTVSRGGGTLSGGAPPPPPPAPKVTRTDTWAATWSRSWRQNGAVSFTGSPIYQGYGDSFNGVQQAAIGFPDLTGTLAGSTIQKVEIYLFAEKWWNFAGGTAGIGHHGSLAQPGTFPGIANYFTVPGWKANEGRWIDVTGWAADLVFGGIRGFSLAAFGGTTSAEFYGRFSGFGGYNPPKIRIQYTK